MKGITRVAAMCAAALLPLIALAGPVNINTADAETLSAELKGIGLSKAQAIVEYRQKNGPFRTPDDLVNVRGVGLRTVDITRENILVDAAKQSAR